MLALLPHALVQQHKVLPVAFSHNRLTLAMTNPNNIVALDDVRRVIKGVMIEPVAVAEEEFKRFLATTYAPAVSKPDTPRDASRPRVDRTQESIDLLQSDLIRELQLAEDAAPDVAETKQDLMNASEDAPIIRLANSEKLGVSLCFQGFEQELSVLETMYAAPSGSLLLLDDGGAFKGCVGVRPLGGECEMKRLYVKGSLRGQGWGRALAEAAAERGRELGYRRLYLDTLPAMTEARALYAHMGFEITEPYYLNPIEGVTYMVKDLAR